MHTVIYVIIKCFPGEIAAGIFKNGHPIIDCFPDIADITGKQWIRNKGSVWYRYGLKVVKG